MEPASPHPTPAQTVDEAVRRIRAHGERVTVARTAVLRVLADPSAPGYLTADGIFAEVNRAAPGVHRTTIYRALDALERLGLVVQTRMGQDAAAYRLAGELTGEDETFVHVRCRVCGTVARAAGDLLDDAAKRLADDSGFTLDPMGVALTGVCASCAATPASRRAAP
ncbi:MAG: transcriptional repressor [Streptomycetaceae bacterium]|nr:transcriptional repressor [Streptomycetaceae bacterium]